MSGLSRAKALTLAVLAGLPGAGLAQLPTASAVALGTGNNYTALVRGFGAIGLNPAGLGMPGTPGFSIAVAPVRVSAGLHPIGLSDLHDFEGRLIPDDVKRRWLEDIALDGAERGSLGADASAFSLNIGSFGLQLSSFAKVDLDLNEDAAELVLFGNAGRRGAASDFELAGSSVDGFAATTLAASFALPTLTDLAQPGSSFSVGATLKFTVGHFLVLSRDGGSQLQSDPLRVELSFPTLGPGEGDDTVDRGSGVGLDVGAAWTGGPLALGASIQNVFNTFNWELSALSYRPASALFEQGNSASDFEERPAGEAPAFLRDEVDELGFQPWLNLGGALDLTPALTITADIRHELGDGLDVGPRRHIGVGGELRAAPFVTLYSGLALVSDATRLAGGLGLALGPVNLTGSAMIQRGDRGDAALGMVTLSFGGR